MYSIFVPKYVCWVFRVLERKQQVSYNYQLCIFQPAQMVSNFLGLRMLLLAIFLSKSPYMLQTE